MKKKFDHIGAVKIRIGFLILATVLLTACDNSVKDVSSTPKEQMEPIGQTEKTNYVRFEPAPIDGIELNGFDIEAAYKLDANTLVIAYSDGDLETSQNPSNWGDRLLLMKGDSVVFQSKPVGDPYQYEPFFYQNTANNKVVIICQLGNEENYGGEAFLFEKGSITFMGKIKVENPKETPNNTGLIEIIRISEVENTIYLDFDSDTLIDLTNEEWSRIKNDSIRYEYNEGHFTLKGI